VTNASYRFTCQLFRNFCKFIQIIYATNLGTIFSLAPSLISWPKWLFQGRNFCWLWGFGGHQQLLYFWPPYGLIHFGSICKSVKIVNLVTLLNLEISQIIIYIQFVLFGRVFHYCMGKDPYCTKVLRKMNSHIGVQWNLSRYQPQYIVYILQLGKYNIRIHVSNMNLSWNTS